MTTANEVLPLLDDILVRAESALDRRLAGAALVHPRDAALAADITPEINRSAVAFFRRLARHKDDLMAAAPDDLRSIDYARHCCAGSDFWYFLGAVRIEDGVIASDVLRNWQHQIAAVRAVRKTLAWIEQQPDLVDLIEQEAQPYE